MCTRMLGVADDSDPAQLRNDLLQQLQALAIELNRHECHARHVAAWSGKTVGESCRNGIGAHAVHDGNGQAESTDLESGCALRHDEIDGQSHQRRSEFGNALNHVVAVTELDHEVAALDIAEISKGAAHRVDVRRQARRLLCGEPTDADDLRCALRGNGPRHRGDGEKGSQKHPSFHSITLSACGARAVGLPHAQPAAERQASPWARPELF